MTVPALVWVAVGFATTLLVAVVLVALVREGMLLGRTVGRLVRELESVGLPRTGQRARSGAGRGRR